MQRIDRWFVPIALIYFAALATAACGEALFSTHSVISAPDMDIDRYFYSIRSFTFDRIRAGEFPLWNPHTFGGMPTLGNFQYAMLYPPNWLHAVLPVGLAIDVIVALHLALAGFFAALWCRWRGAGVVAALIGGTIFMFSGPLMTRLYGGHLTFLCVVAWAPLVMWSADAIIERRDKHQVRIACLFGAAAVAMQVLAGYPQPVHNTILVVSVYAFLRLIRASHRWQAVAWIAGMYALGAALSAAQLLPGIDAGREMVRGGDVPAEFSMSFSLPPENLLTTIVPHLLGDEFAAPYFGRWAVWETSLFVGTVAALLAMVAILFCGTWRNRALGIALVIIVLLALGQYTPLYPLLLKILPGLEQFRGPARIGFLATLIVAVLASEGFDWLWRAAPKQVARIAIAVAGCSVVVLAAGTIVRVNHQLWASVLMWMTRSGEQWPDVIAGYDAQTIARSAVHASGQLLRSGISFAEIAIVLALVYWRRPWAYVLGVLMLGQVWVASEPFRQKFQPYTQAPTEWREGLGALRADERVLVLDQRHFNLPGQLGVDSMGGYDPSLSRRWANLVAPLLGNDPLLGSIGGEPVQGSPVWSMLRMSTTLPPAKRAFDDPMPRVLLVEQARIVAGPAESLAAVREASFDPRRVVIVEQEPGVELINDAPGEAGKVRIERITADRLEIIADLHRDAILLITDAYAAGWRCRAISPGAQTRYEVLPANHALRAISLRAGTHHIAVEYRPASVTVGAIISIIALAAWLIACARLAYFARSAKRSAARPPTGGRPWTTPSVPQDQ